MTTNNSTTNGKKKPDWKLVQNKAHFKQELKGGMNRVEEQVEIASGWQNISKDGNEYISFSLSTTPVMPDVDGNIKLVLFAINRDEAGESSPSQ